MSWGTSGSYRVSWGATLGAQRFLRGLSAASGQVNLACSHCRLGGLAACTPGNSRSDSSLRTIRGRGGGCSRDFLEACGRGRAPQTLLCPWGEVGVFKGAPAHFSETQCPGRLSAHRNLQLPKVRSPNPPDSTLGSPDGTGTGRREPRPRGTGGQMEESCRSEFLP